MGCVLLGLATNTCPGRNQHQRQGENGTPRARACGACAGQDPRASSRARAEGGGALRSVLGRHKKAKMFIYALGLSSRYETWPLI